MQMSTAITSKLVRYSVSAAAFALAAVAGAGSAFADDSVNTGYFGGVALMGYDTVAYFTEGKAVKGSDEFSYEWLGTPWHFASKEHQEMFMSEPAKYAPQYGGYCAGEVAGSGSVTVNIDPEAFKIIDEKLYLIYDQGNADAFADNATDQIPTADVNWPVVEAKLAVDQPDWDSINNP
ncbi:MULTISPECIES: YHS domain-containing (seleno)protein [unclassified Mesorhizobium]|uniref:YHS domain-containing (seleno)protein n=2 Tax=unclassified Mesorhizobium TaxID=325217 RepID=UPI0024789E33|nr:MULTISPECIES: YHS domain-containing (seleno)protein [unclassified Mesorhizobium]